MKNRKRKTLTIRISDLQASALAFLLDDFVRNEIIPKIEKWRSENKRLEDLPESEVDACGGLIICRAVVVTAMVRAGIVKPEAEEVCGMASLLKLGFKFRGEQPQSQPHGTMIKFYKNQMENGNGDIVVQTDAVDEVSFLGELPEAIIQAMETQMGDEEFALGKILSHSFEILTKLRGYKTDHVHEQKVLTCGYSNPDQCKVIVDTTHQTGPLSRAGIAEEILDENFRKQPEPKN